jgi:nucleotide-binding universal stress UspA family protein
MKRILVGVDDALEAGTAVRWAARLAAALEAEVILVNVWHAPADASPTDAHEEDAAERRERLERLWEREVRAEGVPVRAEVFEGDPREVLLEVAEGEQVDFIVVARSGLEGERPGLLHLGSVVEYLAHESTWPLAVIPAETPSTPPTHIMLGVDGSPESANAVRWCAEHARALHSKVTAVNVQSPHHEHNPKGTPDDWLNFVETQEVPDWSGPLLEAGVSVEPVALRSARPATGLLTAAGDHESDLLVIGTRGLGGFLGLRIGGTALRVLHRSEIPLVLVPDS